MEGPQRALPPQRTVLPFNNQQWNVFLFVVVVFVAALVLLSSTGKGQGTQTIRRASLSLRKYDYFDTLERSMDRRVDPCTNFYQYVCGNWAKANPSATSNFQLVQRRIQTKAKRLIEEGLFNPDQPLSRDKVIAGFRHCYRVRTDRREDIRIVKNFLQDNGVLQVTGDRMHSDGTHDEPLDILNVLVRLDLKYTLSITHAIRPIIDFRTQDRLIPMVEVGMLLPGWMKAFRYGISAAASVLGGKRFYTNVVRVQSRVETWMAESRVTVPEYTTLRDMLFTTSPEVSLHRWLHAINSNIELNLTSHTEVYFFSPVGVRLTDKLVDEYSTRPKAALNWIAMVLFHYLSTASSLRLIGSFRRHRPRCSNYMAHVAPYVLAAMLTSKEIGSKQIAIARYIRKKIEATATTSMFTWLDAETERHAVERFKNITIIMGVPDHLQAPGELEKHYKYLPRFESPFVHYYLEALRLKASFAFRGYPIEANTSLSHLRSLAHGGDVSPSATARYIEYFHMVFFPTTLLLPPFIVPESPSATYGGFGHVLAHEMFHAFDTTSIETSASGTMKMWLSPESKKEYDSKVQCVLERYAAEKLPGSWTYSVKTRDENFADVAGYQAALAALMKYDVTFLKGRSPLPGLTNEQLFYVSLCHKWCTASASPTSWKPTSNPRADHRCNIVLNTAEEFQAAFRCPRNKTTLCSLNSEESP